jgi:regulator of sigma E protease
LDTFLSIISIIGALVILGIIIMVHELGHYSIGRLCKIRILEFSVGFGPKIKSWVKNGIIYSIRWIWLGGFTKFYGEDDELDDTEAFNKQPAGRRALTIAAGPAFNIVFAFLFAVLVLSAFGEFVPVVNEVWEGGPAQEAGIREGDIIVEMNGVDIDFMMETAAAGRKANEQSMTITVLRGEQEISYDLEKQYFETYGELQIGRNMAGFSYTHEPTTFGFFEAIALSFKWTFSAFRETVIGFLALFSGLFAGAVPEGVKGIGGIVEELGYALRQNFMYLLQLCAVINISLAVFNIAPLPALDGGRLVFIGIEKVFRKPVPRKVEGVIHFVGIILLFGLMGFFLFRDAVGWFGG